MAKIYLQKNNSRLNGTIGLTYGAPDFGFDRIVGKIQLKNQGVVMNRAPAILYVPHDDDTPDTFAHISYVTPTGGGLRDGSSWANAYGDIQTAIDKIQVDFNIDTMSCDISVVAIEEGTYTLSSNIVPREGVSVYGGFKINDKRWASRDPINHATILDADYMDYGVRGSVRFSNNQVIDGIKVINMTGTSAGFYTSGRWYLKNCTAYKCVCNNNDCAGFKINGSASFCYAIDCHSNGLAAGFDVGDDIRDSWAINCSTSNANGVGGFLCRGIINRCTAAFCEYGFYNYVQACSLIDCRAICDTGTAFCLLAEEYVMASATRCKAIDCKEGFKIFTRFEYYYDNVTLNSCVAINCGDETAADSVGGFLLTNFWGGGRIINCAALNCEGGLTGGIYANGLITNFTAVNCKGGIRLQETTRIYNSVAWNCGSSDIQINDSSSPECMYNCAYQTISGPPYHNSGTQILTESPFVGSGNYPLDIIGRADISFDVTTDIAEINAFATSLINAAADIHPNITSILIGHGTSTISDDGGNISVTKDIENNTRANPPTIGAYELPGE